MKYMILQQTKFAIWGKKKSNALGFFFCILTRVAFAFSILFFFFLSQKYNLLHPHKALNGVKHLLSDWRESITGEREGEGKSVIRNYGQVRRCNLKIRFWAGAELEEDGGVCQLLPYTLVCQAVDVPRGGWTQMESSSSHHCGRHCIRWLAYHQRVVSECCANNQRFGQHGLGLGAAVTGDTASHSHPWSAPRVLYLGLCLCFIKSIMQMYKNKGEAWPCPFEVTGRLSLPFISTEVYLLPLFCLVRFLFFSFFVIVFKVPFMHTEKIPILINEISVVNIVEIPFISNKKRRAHL